MRPDINASGADGSGSSTLIYSTPDYEHDQHGASINHGSFEVGSGDRSRVEVVEMHFAGADFRVKADDVSAELRELCAALERTAKAVAGVSCDESRDRARDAGEEDELRAFHDLSRAVFRAASERMTIDVFQKISRRSFEDGVRCGERALRMQFRELLGIPFSARRDA